MAEMPAYGTEKYTLVSGGVGDQLQPHRIEHRIWTETGRTTFFDEKAKDFVAWPGSWVTVQTFGPFETPAAATEFMRVRTIASANKDER
jgi:hypothetical protein